MADTPKPRLSRSLPCRRRGALTNHSPAKPLRLHIEQLEERLLLSHAADLGGILYSVNDASSATDLVVSDSSRVLLDASPHPTISFSAMCAFDPSDPDKPCHDTPRNPFPFNLPLIDFHPEPEPELETVLDPTFGDGGTVVTELGEDIKTVDAFIHPSGRIVIAGQKPDGSVVLASYNPDGSLDATFGEGGISSLELEFDFWINDLAVQDDGQILITGFSWEHDSSFVTARITVQGQLDPEFGVGGFAITDFGHHGLAKSIAIQPDGKILVRGQAWNDITEDGFALVRYHSDGSLDTTFENGGIVTDGVVLSKNSRSEVAIQNDGRIIVADQELRRYNPDGSIDESFGTGGVAEASGNPWIHHLAIQEDGKILAGGKNLVRYNPDGSLDSSFGEGGVVSSDLARGQLALDAEGNILVSGIHRFSSEGQFEGRVSYETLGVTGVRAFAIQPDGSLVIAGSYSGDSSESGFALARFQIVEPAENSEGEADNATPEDNSQEENSNETAVTTSQADDLLALAPEVFDPVSLNTVSAQQTEPDTPRPDAVQEETVDLALSEITSDDNARVGIDSLGGSGEENSGTDPTDEALADDLLPLLPLVNLAVGLSG